MSKSINNISVVSAAVISGTPQNHYLKKITKLPDTKTNMIMVDAYLTLKDPILTEEELTALWGEVKETLERKYDIDWDKVSVWEDKFDLTESGIKRYRYRYQAKFIYLGPNERKDELRVDNTWKVKRAPLEFSGALEELDHLVLKPAA